MLQSQFRNFPLGKTCNLADQFMYAAILQYAFRLFRVRNWMASLEMYKARRFYYFADDGNPKVERST